MRISFLIMLACGACVCLTATGQVAKTPPKLVAVRATYEKTLDKAKAVYDESVKQAGEDYKRQLTALLEEETKAGNLDAALMVREESKRVDDGTAVTVRKVNTKAELKKALAGSRWNWGDAPLLLQADGVARHPGWEASKQPN